MLRRIEFTGCFLMPIWVARMNGYMQILLFWVPHLQREFPEVEDFLRMTKVSPVEVNINNQVFTEDHIIQADSSFFDFFSIPVLKGDLKNLLNAPHKVVLSESTAKKYFGDENPIDKVIKIGSDTIGYSVSGVMGDIPDQFSF